MDRAGVGAGHPIQVSDMDAGTQALGTVPLLSAQCIEESWSGNGAAGLEMVLCCGMLALQVGT